MSSKESVRLNKLQQTFPKAQARHEKGKRAGIPNLCDIAELIQEGKVKNVVIMAGAGISTSAGIPDFRSPETGLYANLEKYQLPYPEAIFDIDYFLEKPQAFYTLAKELYPGNFKPTLTHYFFRLLQEKGLLRAVFTQNIDTLEKIAGLSEESIIEAHGSFGSAECLNCKAIYTTDEIRPRIQLGEVVRCVKKGCVDKKSALIKPKIVFFGEGLPKEFFDRLPDLHICDLLIVLGTSLSVQPFASLIHRVPLNCPRLLINLESVGEAIKSTPVVQRSTTSSSDDSAQSDRSSASSGSFGPDSDVDADETREGFDFDGRTKRLRGIRDVHFLGTADEGIEKLAGQLGWGDELQMLFKRERDLLDGNEKTAIQPEENRDVLAERLRKIVLEDLTSPLSAKELEKSRSEEDEQIEDSSARP